MTRRGYVQIGAGVLLTLSHLLVASGIGALQFGPRLLLPALPFLALALFTVLDDAAWEAPDAPGAAGIRAAARPVDRVLHPRGAGDHHVPRRRALERLVYVYFWSLFPPGPEGMPVYNLAFYKFPLRHVLRWVSLGVGLVAAWRLLALEREAAP